MKRRPLPMMVIATEILHMSSNKKPHILHKYAFGSFLYIHTNTHSSLNRLLLKKDGHQPGISLGLFRGSWGRESNSIRAGSCGSSVVL